MYEIAFEYLFRIQEACSIAGNVLESDEEIPARTRMELKKWFDRVWEEAAERYNELEDMVDGEDG